MINQEEKQKISEKYGLPLIEIQVYKDKRLYDFPMKYVVAFLKLAKKTPARTVYRHYKKYITIKVAERPIEKDQ
jgi:hypothetical protein